MLRFFDTWEVRVDGQVKSIPSRKRVALLAYLAIEADQKHSRSELLGLSWPEMTDTQARNNLRVVLAGLRGVLQREAQTLPPILVSNRHEVWFEAQDQVWLDVAEFRRLLAESNSHLHEQRATCPTCQQLLAEAIELYRGELLRGFHLEDCPAFDEWLLIRRESWHLQAIQILEELSTFHETAGTYDLAEKYTRRQLQLDPLQEVAQRQLMRLLAYQGQRSTALSQFEQCQQILQSELGVEPEAETLWLYQQIKEGQIEPPTADGAAQELTPPTDNIPVMLTPFIGRETELARLEERLAEASYRLLTIIGQGGIGKTRLAIQAARHCRHHFKDGVFFVSLAELGQPSEIPSAILTAVGVATGGSTEAPQEQLLSYLKPRHLLLVVDNLEHLMAGIDILAEILSHAPLVSLLVTSREELPLQAADVFLLHGLAVPPPALVSEAKRYEAVRLFADRAKRVDKSFYLDETVLPDVIEICRLVEGLPLGIELAASVIRDLSCQEVAQEIGHDLEILSTVAHDVSPHHRSMQAVFDYPWHLLSEAEQITLAQLAVFRGGFDLAAAKTVSGASRLLISQLRYKSLLRSRGSGRYDLHFLIRQLALTKLEALAHTKPDLQPLAIEKQHSQYYLAMLTKSEEEMQGWTPNQVIKTLHKDLDNVRQAWQFAITQPAWPLLFDVPRPLSRFYSLSGLYIEGETVFKEALAKLAQTLSGQAKPNDLLQSLHTQLLFAVLIHLLDQIKISEARPILHELHERANEIADYYTLAFVYLQLGATHINQGDNETAHDYFTKGQEIAIRQNYPKLEGLFLRAFANIWRQRGDYERFEADLLRSLEIQKAAEHAAEVQTILTWLGIYRRNQGDIWGGRAWLEEAMTFNEQVGDHYREATILAGLAVADMDVGHYQASLEKLAQAMRIYEGLNDIWHVVWGLGLVALAHYYQGRILEAIQQAQRSIKLGLTENMQEVVARSQIVLAYALTANDQPSQAADQFERAGENWEKIGNPRLQMESLAGLAELALKENRLVQAMVYLSPILEFIETNDLFGTVDPFRIYWVCYSVLNSMQDERANHVLQQAYSQIQTQTKKIDDPVLAQSYRKNIASHAQAITAWQRIVPLPSNASTVVAKLNIDN